MGCRGRAVMFFFAFALLVIWSCYKPYQHDDYVVVDGPSASYMGENLHSYSNFMAGGAVVKISFAGESDNDAPFVQHGPYEVCVSVWRERQTSSAPIVSIESLIVYDRKGHEIEVVSSQHPVALSFKKHGDYLESAATLFRKKIDLQANNEQHVYVNVMVKIEIGCSRSFTTLKYDFIHKITRGSFRPWVI